MDQIELVTSQDIYNWLALERIPMVGPLTIAKLIESFREPQEVFRASAAEIRRKTGLSERLSKSIALYQPASVEINRDMSLLDRLEARLITRWGQYYPSNLKDIYDPPALLFVRGSLLAEDYRAVAMVGTRNPTRYGIEFAKSLTRDLVRSSFTIISGLARGIDTVCHQTALKEGGRTIAVIGCGLDVVYPKENERLIQQIADRGAVVSEFRPGIAPLKTNFFRRNRIVSGLSKAVIVVQAAKKSGSLITAYHALEQNRDVFAVPGAITNERSRGPHYLIKQGAGLVESAEDIISAISTCECKVGGLSGSPCLASADGDSKIKLSETEQTILDFLDLDPTPIDIICESLKIGPGRLSAILLELELTGLIRQSPGKLFSRVRP